MKAQPIRFSITELARQGNYNRKGNRPESPMLEEPQPSPDFLEGQAYQSVIASQHYKSLKTSRDLGLISSQEFTNSFNSFMAAEKEAARKNWIRFHK
jgi:hypothetical protein